MKDYDIILKKLQDFPQFRERKFRGKFLAKLALRHKGLENKFEKQLKLEPVAFTLDELSDFAIKYDSFRHAWGEVTREHKELRGSDYKEGQILAQEKQLELGYTPGHKKDLEKLATLL